MSRCIPFPPPGYVWNGEGGEALIELIKLNRESVEAEKERKKEKRRKREKRGRKKEEKKRREDGEVGQERQNKQNRNKDGSKKRSWEKGDNEKGRKYEAQGLETSSLTEELEQPTISDCIYDSSNNSNNIKRKRVKCSPNASQNHESHFNFQLQKHKDQAALSSIPACSTPTCTDTLVQEFEIDPRPRKDQFCSTFGLPTTTQEMASGTTREICLSPFPTEVVSDEKAETAPALSLSESCSLQMESQYRVLIVNWVPPPLQNEHSKFDDQEWLFQRRQPRSDMIQKTNICSYDFCHGSCILYPYANYLPEVDIYALPYTVLF